MKSLNTTGPESSPLTRREVPAIPSLTPRLEVDVEALGSSDLITYVNFTGMRIGDVITINWRGVDPDGEPVDEHTTSVVVREPDPILGMPIPINNRLMVDGFGGSAFYSYHVNHDMTDESRRVFCYLGLRDWSAESEGLAVVQALQSHAKVVATDDLPTAGAAVVIPSYQAMHVGDKVTLVFQGTDDQGYPSNGSYPLTLKAADMGRPLRWTVPSSKLAGVEGGRVELFYTLRLVGKSDDLISPLQTFEVVKTAGKLPDRLPHVSIDGHAGGALDPGTFPQGLTLRAKRHADAAPGDQVLLHWYGKRANNRFSFSQRLDASSLEVSDILFQLDSASLLASVGDEVQVLYQFAREGEALTSQPLTVQVQAPRVMPAPTVENATGEAGGAAVEGTSITGGAYVVVPTLSLGDDESLEVHWTGHPNGGQYIATQPVDVSNPWRFLIPASAIAANMEREPSLSDKRFPLTYQIVASTGRQASASLGIRILPLPLSNYPKLICVQAESNGDVSLGKLGAGSATLRLLRWPFMAQGQPLTISVTGVLPSGAAVSQTLRNAVPLSAGELSAGRVELPLQSAFLRTLKLDSQLSLLVSVAFDGEHDTRFPTLFLTVRT